MKLKTKAFGEIEVSEKQRINFRKGLFGFEDLHKFVLLDSNSDDSPFYWLQSELQPETAFVVIDPFLVQQDYKLDIPEPDVKDLEITKEEDLLIFSIVTVAKHVDQISVNLLGPIIINKNTRFAKQIINQVEYSIKHPLVTKQEEKC